MTAEKDVQVARKKGKGGGREVIRAMPERKHLFLYEVFPKWMVGNFRENPKSTCGANNNGRGELVKVYVHLFSFLLFHPPPKYLS